jgi:hypothetical protein
MLRVSRGQLKEKNSNINLSISSITSGQTFINVLRNQLSMSGCQRLSIAIERFNTVAFRGCFTLSLASVSRIDYTRGYFFIQKESFNFNQIKHVQNINNGFINDQ